ncbi:MAG: UDP-3-O-(3-hydroxymyristoyl)glucosamine N-acyltransferase [Rikenellaceae bacterium]|jgi:UDP-3-O-[3-hydroxymyristoyl] glucosamine N-acyltransferase|nr:UDP-3-O-(3-hydroxymyristoyl)glucosamine N-acyltransferase [Rikenellaceae bacterium]
MEFTAELIADFLGGEVVGDKAARVTTISKIESGEPGTLAFLANPKYEHYIYDTQATIVLVGRDFAPQRPVSATLIRVDDAYGAFARILELYHSMKPAKSGVSPQAFISSTVTVGKDAYIGEFAVIGENVTIGDNAKIYPQVYVGDNVVIGEGVTLYAGVKIYEECVLGDHVTIHSGAVIGADGFGFAPQPDGSYRKIPQVGNVVIEDWVEIGANTCVDRATMGSTIIHKGVKLDDLVLIAHNVQIGENTVFSAQVGVAGSTKIGSRCMFGGQVGVAGHISVADGTQVASQSGIAQSVKEENQRLMGSPAYAASAYQRSSFVFRDLPAMSKRLAALEKELERLRAETE